MMNALLALLAGITLSAWKVELTVTGTVIRDNIYTDSSAKVLVLSLSAVYSGEGERLPVPRILSIYVTDSGGVKYHENARLTALMQEAGLACFVCQFVTPGKPWRGYAAFEVPDDAAGFSLTLESGGLSASATLGL